MTKLTQKEIDELLEMKKKVQKAHDKRKHYNEFRNTKRQMLIDRAIKANVTVTKEEVYKALGWSIPKS